MWFGVRRLCIHIFNMRKSTQFENLKVLPGMSSSCTMYKRKLQMRAPVGNKGVPWLWALGRNKEIRFQSNRDDCQTSSLGPGGREAAIRCCLSPPHGGPCEHEPPGSSPGRLCQQAVSVESQSNYFRLAGYVVSLTTTQLCCYKAAVDSMWMNRESCVLIKTWLIKTVAV